MCLYPENVIATMLDGYIAFVNATPIQPEAVAWPAVQLKSVEKVYAEIIRTGYAGPRGFGSLEAWARAIRHHPGAGGVSRPRLLQRRRRAALHVRAGRNESRWLARFPD